MAESMNALARRGLVSSKVMNATLRQTKAQKTKMARFDGRKRDEASNTSANTGEVPTSRELNHPTNQADRAKSMPSKGGSVGRTGGVSNRHIDQNTGQKWPAESTHYGRGVAHASSVRQANTRAKGTTSNTGGDRIGRRGGVSPEATGVKQQQGGPNSRKYS